MILRKGNCLTSLMEEEAPSTSKDILALCLGVLSPSPYPSLTHILSDLLQGLPKDDSCWLLQLFPGISEYCALIIKIQVKESERWLSN